MSEGHPLPRPLPHGAVEGSFFLRLWGIETLDDELEHFAHARFDGMGGDSQDTVAACFQLALACQIGFLLSRMNRSVDFHDQALYRTAKVCNEGADWVLSPKCATLQPAASQLLP